MSEQTNSGKIIGRGRLEGKVAIVTGAGTRLGPDPEYGKAKQVASSKEFPGTGRAIAICFAREGARVLLADKSIEQAEITLEVIRKEGGVLAALPLHMAPAISDVDQLSDL